MAAEYELLHESGHGETIVVAHSRGCVSWLQAAYQGAISPLVVRALLVSPSAPETLGQIPELILNLESSAVRESTLAVARTITLVGSDGHPWLGCGIQATYRDPLGLTPTVLESAQHLSFSDGWEPWQGVIDWVANLAADLSAR